MTFIFEVSHGQPPPPTGSSCTHRAQMAQLGTTPVLCQQGGSTLRSRPLLLPNRSSPVTAAGKGGPFQVRQAQVWQDLLAWEKSNPMRLDGPALSVRVSLTYDEALTVLMHFPDVRSCWPLNDFHARFCQSWIVDPETHRPFQATCPAVNRARRHFILLVLCSTCPAVAHHRHEESARLGAGSPCIVSTLPSLCC